MTSPAQDFDAFVQLSGPRLLRSALLLTGDRHRAEELLQDVLVKAYVRWSRIDSDPEAYVRRSLLNAERSSWRRRRRETSRSDPPDHPSVADTAAEVSRVDQVARALAGLTTRERQVLVLRYWEDLTEAQTAAELGVAIGTVKSTAHRGLTKLRQSSHLTVPPSEELSRERR